LIEYECCPCFLCFPFCLEFHSNRDTRPTKFHRLPRIGSRKLLLMEVVMKSPVILKERQLVKDTFLINNYSTIK
jgi:hypothetical protein